jgi:glycolate oxidase FAD binding subunit
VIDRLIELIGEDAVSRGEFAAFHIHGRRPSAVVTPWNIEQAAAVLRVCSENRWIVEPAGGGTWLDWGRPPGKVDVLLSAERLAGVTDYQPADLTVTVAAGTPLHEIAETVSADRQTLGLDPAVRPGATIGAVISHASAGPLRLSMGTPRDQVLGVQIVTGDGRVVNLGGRVVKNVAGYDLVRLVVGSRGTLGFITRAHLRLRPEPEEGVTALYHADAAEPLLDLAAGPATRVWPAAMELVSPATSDGIGREASWTLAVRCRGNGAFVAEATRRLGGLLPGVNPDVLDQAEENRFWDGLGNLEARAAVEVGFGSLPSRLGLLIRSGEERIRNGDVGEPWHMAAHVGNGILRMWLVDRISRERTERLYGLIHQARTELQPDGGSVIAPRIDSIPDSTFDPFGHPGPVFDLMNGIKSAFDPAGVLSPGRFTV